MWSRSIRKQHTDGTLIDRRAIKYSFVLCSAPSVSRFHQREFELNDFDWPRPALYRYAATWWQWYLSTPHISARAFGVHSGGFPWDSTDRPGSWSHIWDIRDVISCSARNKWPEQSGLNHAVVWSERALTLGHDYEVGHRVDTSKYLASASASDY